MFSTIISTYYSVLMSVCNSACNMYMFYSLANDSFALDKFCFCDFHSLYKEIYMYLYRFKKFILKISNMLLKYSLESS